MPKPPASTSPDADRFLKQLRQGLDQSGVKEGDHLLVAISGGADSTAVLLGLRQLITTDQINITFHAAHFNHHLRGDDSMADEVFCQRLCETLPVEMHIGRGDVSGHSERTGVSVETAARELRYLFLAETAVAHGFNAVLTGHTMDDQAETVLLAVARGAGLRGLSGMSYRTLRHDIDSPTGPLVVLRPMLEMRRLDTERFCSANGVTPQLDVSNLDPAYARNRIRRDVIPALRQLNPEVVTAISRLTTVATADVELIDSMAEDALSGATLDESGGISRNAVSEMAPALRMHVLSLAYRKAAGSARDLELASLLLASGAIDSVSTGRIDLPNRVHLEIEHSAIRFLTGSLDPECPYPTEVLESVLEIPGDLVLPGGATISARIVSPVPSPATLADWQALIKPAIIIESGLKIRSRRDGDRFHPLGMPREMKLQDFLVNSHVPARWRDRLPLVLAGKGICWVTGQRIADWAKISPDDESALLLEYSPPSQRP